MELDPAVCYPLIEARDRRYDGVFFVGVSSTRVYCRPVCPARTPHRDRCTFFRYAAAAEAAGYRACLRCRPERAPGNAPIDAVGRLVRRAVARIEAGALNGRTVPDLAARLGVTSRHLRRAFEAEIGTSPHRYAQTRRLATARTLLRETSLPIDEVAIASGFGSVRRFQAAMRQASGQPPREVRRNGRAPSALVVSLDARPPFDAARLFAFLGARALPGVEEGGPDRYARTVQIGPHAGSIEVTARGPHTVALSCSPQLGPVLMQIVARVRALFDLDARPDAVSEHLSADRRLQPSLRSRPGLRVPGAFDPFELAVRAVVGQQISVRAATAIAGRLARALGAPVRTDPPALDTLFPDAATLAAAPPERLIAAGLSRSKAATLIALSAAVASDRLDLLPGADPTEIVAALQRIGGIGPWTANSIAMRALGWPDAFPGTDLVVRRALSADNERQSLAAASAWRPWRAYAVMHLWTAAGEAP